VRKHFKDRNKGVLDDTRSGRPSSTDTDVNTDETEAHKQIVKGAYCANTLTTNLWNIIWKKMEAVVDESVVSASRQCTATFCRHNDRDK
jgi:hypothetical protein